MSEQIETRMAKMEIQLDQVSKSIEQFHSSNKDEHREIFTLITKIEEKKADKEVVDEIRSDIRKVVWMILSAVIISIMALILKP